MHRHFLIGVAGMVSVAGMVTVTAEAAQAEVSIFFTNMDVKDCKEIGTCDWRLSCGLSNQRETQFFSIMEANSNEKRKINRTIKKDEFPATVNCTVEEHDGGIGAGWEFVGSESVIVKETGPYQINLSNSEGDVTIHFDVEKLGSTSQPLTSGPDTCKSGFVWREAFTSDTICVTPKTRTQAVADNAQANQRRVPGSNTCKSGFVWRAARPSDLVCVTPATRAQTAADNAQANQRRVVPR